MSLAGGVGREEGGVGRAGECGIVITNNNSTNITTTLNTLGTNTGILLVRQNNDLNKRTAGTGITSCYKFCAQNRGTERIIGNVNRRILRGLGRINVRAILGGSSAKGSVVAFSRRRLGCTLSYLARSCKLRILLRYQIVSTQGGRTNSHVADVYYISSRRRC